jgi:hypothetical protein
LNPKGLAVVSRSNTGREKVTAPNFLLVPHVKLPKRLDLARDAERTHDAIPGLIASELDGGSGAIPRQDLSPSRQAFREVELRQGLAHL